LNKSDFSIFLFWFYLRILVAVLNKTVRVVEDTGEVVARRDVIEVAKVGEIRKKTIIINKLLVVN